MHDLEFRQKFQGSVHSALYADWKRMLTGRRVDAATVTLSGAPTGKVWVRGSDESREQTAVWGSASRINAGVVVGPGFDGSDEIKSLDNEQAAASFGDAMRWALLPPGGQETVPSSIPGLGFVPGRVEPSQLGDLNLHVRGFWYEASDGTAAYYDGDALDASTALRTLNDFDISGDITAVSGESQWVIVYFDPDTGTPDVVVNTPEVSDPDRLSVEDIDTSAVPLGAYVLGAVAVSGDATLIDSSSVFVDPRFHLASNGDVSLGPGSLTRNTVTPTGDYPALVLTNYSAQTTTLFQVNIAETDPPDDMIGAIVDMTQTLTAATTFGTTALDLKVTLANATFNNTSSGNRALQLRMFATGTSGTISNLLVTQQSMTISGGVAVTTVRSHRINDATVSGGSTLTNNAGLVLVERTAGTNNVHIFMGALANPTGNWAIYSQTSYSSSHLGNLGLGLAANVTPTNLLSLSGQAARTIWMERQTTSNTAGNSLTIQAGGATSGATNKAGGDLTLQTGTNTGNVAPSHVRLMAGVMNPSSGTGDNSNVDRLRVGPTKVLTNNSATTIVNATLASNTMIGGIISYSIQVFDGTNVQTETGMAIYSGINKAGAFTCSITEVNSQQDVSSGTLATTWAISGANPAAISVNANSSLTPSTGYPRITYNIENFAQQSIAIA